MCVCVLALGFFRFYLMKFLTISCQFNQNHLTTDFGIFLDSSLIISENAMIFFCVDSIKTINGLYHRLIAV